MSYFKRPLAGDIEMPPAFVGNENSLPICPQTDQSGWCRNYIGGPPIYRGNPNPQAATTKAPTTTQKKDGGFLSELAKIAGALAINKIGSSPQQSAQPYVVQQGGVSTTTMLIAGGIGVAALLLLMKD